MDICGYSAWWLCGYSNGAFSSAVRSEAYEIKNKEYLYCICIFIVKFVIKYC